jgi:hypothetical protein
MDNRPDIHLAFHGSIIIATGITETGIDWLEENLEAGSMRWGANGYAIEPRYIGQIVEGAGNDGLTVD